MHGRHRLANIVKSRLPSLARMLRRIKTCSPFRLGTCLPASLRFQVQNEIDNEQELVGD